MDGSVLIGIKNVQRLSPSLFLVVGNFAQVENCLLCHAAIGDTSVLHDSVVAMQLAALFSFVASEKHNVIVSDGHLASIP